MTVTIGRGLLSRIRQQPDDIVIQVRDASDPEAAAAALERASVEIAHLDAGGNGKSRVYVAEVLPTGQGPLLAIDGCDLPYGLLRTIPDIVVRHLVHSGVSDATVGYPRQGGSLTEMHYGPTGARAVTLRLYPPPPVRRGARSEIPDGWLREAVSWVGEDMADGGRVRARVDATEFTLGTGSSMAFLRQVRRTASASAELVTGELGVRMRATAGYFMFPEPNLALAAGGPGVSDDELVAASERLRDIARRLASEVAYAFVSADDRLQASRGHLTDWSLVGGEQGGSFALEHLCDEYVFDAFPYQVLGPGHLARLGGPPPGARPLDDGRVEVAIGRPGEWLLEPPVPDWDPYREGLAARRRTKGIDEVGRRLLAPCLVKKGRADAILDARWRKS